jgi:hypothetical protein
VNDRERIAVLEQELAALKSKFEPKPRPARVEEGARIITGREAEGSSAFVMPSAAEMEKLYAIVIGKFPQLGPHVPRNKRWVEDEQREHFEAFVRAFRALGDFGRSDALDTQHAAVWWVDQADAQLRAEGRPGGMSLSAFVAALVSHGDIAFAPIDRFPYDLAFGLRHGGVGHRANAAWKRVLSTGATPTDVVPARRMPTPQPSVTFG